MLGTFQDLFLRQRCLHCGGCRGVYCACYCDAISPSFSSFSSLPVALRGALGVIYPSGSYRKEATALLYVILVADSIVEDTIP